MLLLNGALVCDCLFDLNALLYMRLRWEWYVVVCYMNWKA